MRFLKTSERKSPRLSLILLDWGVRESFHLLHYLKTQTVPRDSFEVIVVEYYDHVSEAVRKFESEVDTWVLLEMPADCYYHKHLMYNAGVVLCHGDILMFGDSDAMVRPTFVETIVTAFDRDPLIVYHMDEFRNVRRDFYPFNYPSFEDVLGDGCLNNVGGKTKGILDRIDPMHTRNYGACMCASRKDVLAIGGADEDMTYLGHICGPYDMTFRLMNLGRRLVWETEEYLYHTWHPGSDGVDNYLGPHDGRNMSTTAFQSLCTGRITPWVENQAIGRLRAGHEGDVSASLIDPAYIEAFQRTRLAGLDLAAPPAERSNGIFATYHGYDVYNWKESYYAVPQDMSVDLDSAHWREDDRVIAGRSFAEVRDSLDSMEARLVESVGLCNICELGGRFAVVTHDLGPIDFRLRSHREHQRIAWKENLADARATALELTEAARRRGRQPRDGAGAEWRAPRPGGLIAHRQSWPGNLADVERRLGDLEAQISGIYRSRTWRALTWMGGLLQKLAYPPRGGKPA